MNATPPRRPRDTAELRVRRLGARRRTRLARIDLGIGVFVALLLVLVSPGLAITAIVALLTLLVCVGSLLVHRRRLRRARPPAPVERGAETLPGAGVSGELRSP